MKQHFLDRGYPEKELVEAMTRVAQLDRATLIAPKTGPQTSSQSEEKPLTLYAITRYHPTSNDFRDVISKNWELLGSPGTQTLYEAKEIFGHRRPRIFANIW